MLRADDVIAGIDYDEELEVVVVRTERATDYEAKLKKKVRTSAAAAGTVFGDVMEQFEQVRLPADAILKTSWLYALTRKINTSPSLYLKAGDPRLRRARRTGRCSTWRTSAGTTRSTRSPGTCS